MKKIRQNDSFGLGVNVIIATSNINSGVARWGAGLAQPPEVFLNLYEFLKIKGNFRDL